jgi:hypothetical protein
MAERFQDSGASQGNRASWRRDWFPYQDYLSILENQLEALRSQGLLSNDTTERRESFDRHNELNLLVVHGRLDCARDVLLEFHEAFRARRGRNNRYELRGIDLSYHAWFPGPTSRDLLRFDDAHGPLHQHIFDELGAEVGHVPCDIEALPSLIQLVEMSLELAGVQP